MNIIDSLFFNQRYKIPVEFETDNFKDEINKLLSDYISDLNKLNIDKQIVDKIKKFRKSCSFTMSNYLRGIHSNAFENFEKAIAALEIDNSPLLCEMFQSDILFRGRENKGNNDYSEDEMYHIPLDKRGIISTQRYSFPGLPCLYAGASVYTCWVEMNRPSLEKFQVVTIRPTEDACARKVYNLSNIPQRINTIKNEKWFNELEYILYWPLMAVCSVKVRHENDIFKPEYIFPQFLLEHILKSKKSVDYIGIKYVSIKISEICEKQYDDDWHTYVNYVFPSHSDSMEDKRCQTLNKSFSIEHNRSGSELKMLTSMLMTDNAKTEFQDEDNEQNKYEALQIELERRHIYTKDGMPYPYAMCDMGFIELAMLRDDFEDIANDKPIYSFLTLKLN